LHAFNAEQKEERPTTQGKKIKKEKYKRVFFLGLIK
jgi:hypothetical protein